MTQDTPRTSTGQTVQAPQSIGQFTTGLILFRNVACALSCLTFVGTGTTQAEEQSSFADNVSANVGITSEYYFRGLSQTDDAPALQGGFEYEAGLTEQLNLYVGAWGSNVDFNEAEGIDSATVEIDIYGGLNGLFGDTGVSWDAGLIYYAYPGAESGLDYDFWELQGAVGYNFEIATLTASINHSPENFAASGAAFYPKIAAFVPVPGVRGLAVSGHVAKQYIDENDVFGTDDYVEWNVAVGYELFGFDLSAAYSDTDVRPNTDGNGEAVIFTVGRSF
ncbi:MAG: hypothetical protein HN813_07210 [Rhodospirillaceae bacterium]|nr:hypothetical protein [Rhodospirillaceae bacterium]MBT7361750.1 hypothetical protein [Rhodospirillaceae bacterium]